MAEKTTIRLPPKLRARIHALSKQAGRSAHSFILDAVERHADYEEQMRSLVKEALTADEEIERTGEVYRADDVHALGRTPGPRSGRCTVEAVATVVYSARILIHLERAFEFLASENPGAAIAAARAIRSGPSIAGQRTRCSGGACTPTFGNS